MYRVKLTFNHCTLYYHTLAYSKKYIKRFTILLGTRKFENSLLVYLSTEYPGPVRFAYVVYRYTYKNVIDFRALFVLNHSGNLSFLNKVASSNTSSGNEL